MYIHIYMCVYIQTHTQRNILIYYHMHIHTYTCKYLYRPWNIDKFFDLQISSVSDISL